jgi:hypothetical protein
LPPRPGHKPSRSDHDASRAAVADESVTLPPDPFAVPVKPQDDLKQRALKGALAADQKRARKMRGRSATANTSTMKPHWRPPSARLIERGSAR